MWRKQHTQLQTHTHIHGHKHIHKCMHQPQVAVLYKTSQLDKELRQTKGLFFHTVACIQRLFESHSPHSMSVFGNVNVFNYAFIHITAWIVSKNK